MLIYIFALPSFAQNNDYTNKINHYTKSRQQNPNSSEAYLNRALSKYKSNDYNGAIEDANSAIQIEPDNSKAYYIRGLCKSKLIENNGNPIVKRNITINSITKPSVDFAPYMKEINKRIKSNWHPPKIYKNKLVILRFKVLKDGKVNSIEVLKSSNIDAMDLAAQRAIEASAPFPPFPFSSTEESIDMEFSFHYNLVGQQNSKYTNTLFIFNIINIFLHGIMHI